MSVDDPHERRISARVHTFVFNKSLMVSRYTLNGEQMVPFGVKVVRVGRFKSEACAGNGTFQLHNCSEHCKICSICVMNLSYQCR